MSTLPQIPNTVDVNKGQFLYKDMRDQTPVKAKNKLQLLEGNVSNNLPTVILGLARLYKKGSADCICLVMTECKNVPEIVINMFIFFIIVIENH